MADGVVLLAGNICAGKTSLLEYVDARIPGTVVPEYRDPEALTLFYLGVGEGLFENSTITGRLIRHTIAKHGSGNYFFDRGIIEGADIFCKNSFADGRLSEDEFGMYMSILENGLNSLDRDEQEKWCEKLVVYVQVLDPELLWERNRKRKVQGENIPLDYFVALNKRYEERFSTPERIEQLYAEYGLEGPELLVVDGSIDWNNQPNYHNTLVNSIEEKMKEMGMYE
jgi:deoxyadenosine/deoxycytidine kinase